MNFNTKILLICLLSTSYRFLIPSQKISGAIKRTVFSSVVLSSTITYVNQVLNGSQDFTKLPEAPSLEAIRDHKNKWFTTLSNTQDSLRTIYAQEFSTELPKISEEAVVSINELKSSTNMHTPGRDIFTPDFNDLDATSSELMDDLKKSNSPTDFLGGKINTHDDPASPTGYDIEK